MSASWMPPGPAQANLARMSGWEADLMDNAALVGVVYGVIVLAGLMVAGWYLVLRARAKPPRWREALSRLYWRPLGSDDARLLVAVVAAGFLLSLLAQPLLLWRAAGRGIHANSLMLIVQSVLFHWVGLGTVCWILIRRRLPWSSAFGIRAGALLRDAGRGALILLGIMPALVLATVLYNLVLQWFGYRGTLQDVAFIISDETSGWMRAYFIVLAVGLAPLFEEILFRGVLLPVLAKRYGAAASTVAVSFLFAGIHSHIPSLVPLFVLSLALCMAYIGTGSLAASIAMHALFNGITITLLFAIR